MHSKRKIRTSKAITLYALPFLLGWILHSMGFRFNTEITGNVGGAIVITGLIATYFTVVIWRTVSVIYTPLVALTVIILALLMLPVRQNIPVADYMTMDSSIYWIERSYFTGEVTVYRGGKGLITKPQQILKLPGPIHLAYLDAKNHKPQLFLENHDGDSQQVEL